MYRKPSPLIDALDDSEHGIPNLERQIAESPVLFVQAVVLAYKRREEGEDPQEWRVQNPEQRAAVALAAHRLLDKITMIPGTDEYGKIDAVALASWLAEVRRLCRECGRADTGDQCIGQLHSRTTVTEDGLWPCEEVCEAMEGIASPQIGRGFYIVFVILEVYTGGAGEANRNANLQSNTIHWLSGCTLTIPMLGGF